MPPQVGIPFDDPTLQTQLPQEPQVGTAGTLGVSPELLSGALGPLTLPPAVQLPPPPPPVSQDPRQQLLAFAALGALLGGWGKGTGPAAAAGLQAAQQQLGAQQDQRYKWQLETALRQQAQVEQDRRAIAQSYDRRGQQFVANIGIMRKQLAAVDTKEEYDRALQQWKGLFQAAGFRVSDQMLDQVSGTFVARSEKQQLEKAYDAYFKNPLNQGKIEQHPELVPLDMLQIRDVDGNPKQISMERAADVIGKPFGRDPEGKILVYPKGTSVEGQANANAIYQDKLRIALRNGEPDTPELRNRLRLAAMREGAEAAPAMPTVITTSEGLGLLDRGTGAVSPIPAMSGAGQAQAPATQAQQLDAIYAGRVQQAEAELTRLETQIQGMNFVWFRTQQASPEVLQSPTIQSYEQASRNFINSLLRLESGAVISPSEFAEARRQYLPLPGNTARVLAQKRANRLVAIEGLKRAAGPAYREPPMLLDPKSSAEEEARRRRGE